MNPQAYTFGDEIKLNDATMQPNWFLSDSQDREMNKQLNNFPTPSQWKDNNNSPIELTTNLANRIMWKKAQDEFRAALKTNTCGRRGDMSLVHVVKTVFGPKVMVHHYFLMSLV